MSLLPQRKKSPEEIAKLREGLGIPSEESSTTSDPSQTTDSAAIDVGVGAEFSKAETDPLPTPKPVRSLRKSEQIVESRLATVLPDSALPQHRHSDKEIAEIRRREAMALVNAKPNPKLVPASLWIIAIGYLAAPAAAIGAYFYQFHLAATFPLLACSLVAAGFIALRHPISKHHAAFVAVLLIFVLVFSLLHHFPHLRNAS